MVPLTCYEYYIKTLILKWMYVCDYVIYFRFMELLVLNTSNTRNGLKLSKPPSPPVTPHESFPPPDVVRTLEELFVDKNLGLQSGVVTFNQSQQQHYLHHHHRNVIQLQVI